ncbi:MAG: patatin-like phospholipase family protein [Alphaproteobacteria bacterium]|nr:patatin-like phospholipase family protein [Alphaproteobacteria bacterium]
MKVERRGLLLAVCVTAVVLQACVPQLSGNFEKDSRIFAYRNQDATHAARGAKFGALVADDNVPWEVPEGFRAKVREQIWSKNDTRSYSEIARALGAPVNSNLVVAGFSGGGHQSMVFGLGVLDELGAYGIRSEIDAMSSVSGGSFAALYYALSRDAGRATGSASKVIYADQANDEFRSTNFFWQYLLRRLSPLDLTQNILNYHDSSDSFVDQLESSYEGILTDTETGEPLTFADLNPERPNLILNATNLSRDRAYFLGLQGNNGIDGEAQQRRRGFEPTELRDLSLHFSFTPKYFERLQSDLSSYPLSRALTASAAFPLIIDPVTLRNYGYRPRENVRGEKFDTPESWYSKSVVSDTNELLSFVHLTDAGVFDNAGASKLKWFIECSYRGRVANNARVGEREPFADCFERHEAPPKLTLAIMIDVATLGGFGRDNKQGEQRLAGSGIPIRVSSTVDAVSNLIFTTSAQRKTSLVQLLTDLKRERRDTAFADFGLEALNDPTCLIGGECTLWDRAKQRMIDSHPEIQCTADLDQSDRSIMERARYRAICGSGEDIGTALRKIFADINEAQSGFKLTATERLLISEAAVWVSARRVQELCDANVVPKLLDSDRATKICGTHSGS